MAFLVTKERKIKYHTEVVYALLNTGILLFTETSHQKLLLQAEGTVETLLKDAQRKITATHEASL